MHVFVLCCTRLPVCIFPIPFVIITRPIDSPVVSAHIVTTVSITNTTTVYFKKVTFKDKCVKQSKVQHDLEYNTVYTYVNTNTHVRSETINCELDSCLININIVRIRLSLVICNLNTSTKTIGQSYHIHVNVCMCSL